MRSDRAARKKSQCSNLVDALIAKSVHRELYPIVERKAARAARTD
jgi:hypothetical protein